VFQAPVTNIHILDVLMGLLLRLVPRLNFNLPLVILPLVYLLWEMHLLRWQPGINIHILVALMGPQRRLA